jgi:hypothetical protein
MRQIGQTLGLISKAGKYRPSTSGPYVSLLSAMRTNTYVSGFFGLKFNVKNSNIQIW